VGASSAVSWIDQHVHPGRARLSFALRAKPVVGPGFHGYIAGIHREGLGEVAPHCVDVWPQAHVPNTTNASTFPIS